MGERGLTEGIWEKRKGKNGKDELLTSGSHKKFTK
jgi:hypothetical protein